MATPSKQPPTIALPTGNTIPNEFNPLNIRNELKRSIYDKVDFKSFDPTDWRPYVHLNGTGNSYTSQEIALLKASFISLDDEKLQADILKKLKMCYYFQVAYNLPNKSAEKTAAAITNQKSKEILDFIALRYKSYDEFAKFGAHPIIDSYIKEATAREFTLAGDKAEISVKLTQAEVQRFVSANPNFANNATLASAFNNVFFSINASTKQLKQQISDLDSKTVYGLGALGQLVGTGIAGVTSEVVSAKDLLKARAQLFTPEQLADPKVQQMLKDQATSDAKLEVEKNKQIIELNRNLRTQGVFDPLISVLADPELSVQMAQMDNMAKNIMPGKSLEQSKFVGPRIKKTDANLNSPLQILKDRQEQANLEEAVKRRPIGRPKGSTKVGKINAFIEQRSINRIKSFINPEQSTTMNKVDQPKENFKYLDPNLAYNPADFKSKHKSFQDIDPPISKEDKVELMRQMMFNAYV